MKKKISVLFVAGMFICVSPSYAEDMQGIDSVVDGKSDTSDTSKNRYDFKKMDHDQNGTLSASEFNGPSEPQNELFGQIDNDGDGAVTQDELNAWLENSVGDRHRPRRTR